ncbi:Glycosyl hydrolase family 10 [Verrucomicrobiia bacterium DG1235]|nr:Glycosyl hydrolase family 10 [Verrucomicrobiae bacterium DG1235]
MFFGGMNRDAFVPAFQTRPEEGEVRSGSVGLALAVFMVACCLGQVGVAKGAVSDEVAIAQHRMGTLVVEAPALAEVTVEQLEHEFWFGAALANQAFDGRMSVEDTKRYKAAFLENFNSAVTENALKWLAMEREKGEVDYATVDAILDWSEANEIPIRGHNIYWGIGNRVMNWQKEMGDEELLAYLEARAFDVGKRYAGRFVEYDLNNEMIHENYYEKRFGKGITKQMAAWVKEADPTAVLYFNDYDILTGAKLKQYTKDIKRQLKLGASIDGIGVQGHLHGESFDPKVLHSSLDELAKFGMPIRVTEFNFPGQRSRFLSDNPPVLTAKEEKAKAQAIVDYYTICFAHPEVEGILMWGFWEGANWIPASSLYKLDWTPTPAAKAYHDLVYKKWWTTWEGQVDRMGSRQVPAFYGKYRVSCNGVDRIVDLNKADGVARVQF